MIIWKLSKPFFAIMLSKDKKVTRWITNKNNNARDTSIIIDKKWIIYMNGDYIIYLD